MNQRVTGWMLWGASLFLALASTQLHAVVVPPHMSEGEERARSEEHHHKLEHHHKHEHKHEHHHHHKS